MKKIFTATAISLFLFSLPSLAETFYVSPAGNDDSSGTSIPSAWKTISKVNDRNLIPGDTILFEAPQTFNGMIYCSESDSGTPVSPVLFSSYGTGRATIHGGNGMAFYLYNTGGIEIKKLNFAGSGLSTDTTDGVCCYTDRSDGKKFEHVHFDSIDIHGFGKIGLVIGSWQSNNSYPGFRGISITNVNSYENGNEGIYIYDNARFVAGTSSLLDAHSSLYIAHCKVYDNVKSGISICGVDTGIIEYCRATHNCTNCTGGVGIWAFSSRNLTFQHCISESTMTTSNDGEGFDLDGGTENCIIQYCYSYANYGPGFMHCDYPSCRPTRNNIIRYCISENDARKKKDDASFLIISWGDGLENCHIFNCTAYSNQKDSAYTIGLRAHILFGYGGSPHISGCSFRNNIAYMDGSNMILAAIDDYGNTGQPQMDTSNIKFQNNCYYATNANSKKWVYYSYGSPYTTLASWQTVTKQEILNGNPVGFYTNPELVSPGNGGSINDPAKMDTLLDAYNLQLTSPMRDTGLDLQGLFSIDMGTYDFYNNPIPFNTKYDVGAYELTKFAAEEKNSLTIGSLSFANPVNGKAIINYGIAYDAQVKLCIYNLSGQLVKTLVNNHLTSGSYKTVFDASHLAKGIYFITLTTDNCKINKKLIILK